MGKFPRGREVFDLPRHQVSQVDWRPESGMGQIYGSSEKRKAMILK